MNKKSIVSLLASCALALVAIAYGSSAKNAGPYPKCISSLDRAFGPCVYAKNITCVGSGPRAV